MPHQLNDLIVLDRIFSPAEVKDFYGKVLDLPIWRFGRASTGAGYERRFWGTKFHRALIEPKIRLLIDRVNHRIAKTSIKSLTPYRIIRIDAGAHTSGSSGYSHQDYDSKDAISLLHYCNPKWKPEWGGETKFYDQRGEEVIQSVLPKPGRVVLFPSRMHHSSSATTPIFTDLRVALNIVFLPKKNSTRSGVRRWNAGSQIRCTPFIHVAQALDPKTEGMFHVFSNKQLISTIRLKPEMIPSFVRIWTALASFKQIKLSNLAAKIKMPIDELVQYVAFLESYMLIEEIRPKSSRKK